MSFLSLIDEKKLLDVVTLLEKYETKIEAVAPLFELEGRRIEEIMRTLPHHQSSYDQSLQEVKALEEWVGNLRDKINAKYWKKYVEGYPRQLQQKDIQAYIGGEQEMVEMNQIVIEVKLVRQRLDAIVEGFKQMGWMMGHITKMRIAELQEDVL